MNAVFVEQLDQQLRDIEASAREYDAGNKDAAIRIARCLRQIFDHTAKSTSLLAQLQARFTRLSSSVDKPPYPQERYSPLAEIEVKFNFPAIHTGARPQNQPVVDPPTYRAMLERKKLTRQVQAPDWWGNEPVMIDAKKESHEEGRRPRGKSSRIAVPTVLERCLLNRPDRRPMSMKPTRRAAHGRWRTKCSRARNYSNLQEGNARGRPVAYLAARSSRRESNPRFLFVREASLPLDHGTLLASHFSSTGGSRTHRHQALDLIAMPIRVPCR